MNLGLDSLVSIEFRQSIGKRFDLRLSNTFLFDFPTILSATEHVFESLQTNIPIASDDISHGGLVFSHRLSDIQSVVYCFTITRPGQGSVCFPQALSKSIIETMVSNIDSFVKIDENGVNLITDSDATVATVAAAATESAVSAANALKGPAIVVMFKTCPGYDSTMIENLKRASTENGLTLVRIDSNGDTTYLVNF